MLKIYNLSLPVMICFDDLDMFGQLVHVETVTLLSKLSEAKHHIEVKVDMDELDLTSAEAKATYLSYLGALFRNVTDEYAMFLFFS